jgi:hypothetical protein
MTHNLFFFFFETKMQWKGLTCNIVGNHANVIQSVEVLSSQTTQVSIFTSMIMKNDEGPASISSSSTTMIYIDLQVPKVDNFRKM